MAILHGDLKHSILPYALAAGTLLTALGTVYSLAPRPELAQPQIVQETQIVETQFVQESPAHASLEEKLTVPVSQGPAKPESVDIHMYVTDFEQIKPLIDYITHKLGYPLNPQQEFIFLPKEEFDQKYIELFKQQNPGQAYTTIGSKAGKITSAKTFVVNGSLFEIIGPVMHELGIYNRREQNLIKGKSNNSGFASSEASAYAFHSAGIKVLEEEYGLENIFNYSRNENGHVIGNLNYYKKMFENGSEVHLGFFAYWMSVLKEPQLENLKEEIETNKKLSSQAGIRVFNFLGLQSNQYIMNMANSMSPSDFSNIAEILTSRASNAQINSLKGGWEAYLP